MPADPHDAMESALAYIPALRDAFKQHDEREFNKWLELQENWLLSGLVRSFALGDADGCVVELSRDEAERRLRESDTRRRTTHERGDS